MSTAAASLLTITRVECRACMRYPSSRRHHRLRGNMFGIPEPLHGSRGRLPVRHLDTILVPLVGFDAQGHRLGMGAGFYDRALRPRLDRTQPFRRPRLIGVAYSIQQVDRLDPAPWDVALDLVVTERGILRFPPHTP